MIESAMAQMGAVDMTANSIVAAMTVVIALTPKIRLNSFEILGLWIVFMGAVANVHSDAVRQCLDFSQALFHVGCAMMSVGWMVKVEVNYFKNRRKRRRKTDFESA